MKDIGGYFELELSEGGEYHQGAVMLNTGRNALEYILLANAYTKLYLPYFSCDVLLEPLKKLGLEIEFYFVNEQWEPVFEYDKIKQNEGFLYINYFGIKDCFVVLLPQRCKNLIIDNSQSFFSKQLPQIDTFYSARKFFGVPDGAYLYCNKNIDRIFEKDVSFNRCAHLLKRLDCSAEIGFEDFKINEVSLQNQEIKQMSSLTTKLLATINYEKVSAKRKQNFNTLHFALKKKNKLKLDVLKSSVPMVYPYWSNDKSLQKRLVENKVFTATYWESVKELCNKKSVEYQFVNEVVYLPIDQRYTENDLKNIVKIIFNV